MNISEIIKNQRKNKKLTQKELAYKINKSERMVQKYESGDVTPSIDVLNKIGEALGVTINELMGLSDEYNRATNLSNTYFDSVMKWSEDRIFSNIETVCIREHFFDLLLRYKQLINTLSNSKYAWINIKESYSEIYKNRKDPLSDTEIKELFLKQELEGNIDNIVNWVKAFPNWMVRREIELDNEPITEPNK